MQNYKPFREKQKTLERVSIMRKVLGFNTMKTLQLLIVRNKNQIKKTLFKPNKDILINYKLDKKQLFKNVLIQSLIL